jgi:hypothetical protein
VTTARGLTPVGSEGPTWHDRYLARVFYSPPRPCPRGCGVEVWGGWDWRRREACWLERRPGTFDLTHPLQEGQPCPGVGLVRYVPRGRTSYLGHFAKHVCEGRVTAQTVTESEAIVFGAVGPAGTKPGATADDILRAGGFVEGVIPRKLRGAWRDEAGGLLEEPEMEP